MSAAATGPDSISVVLPTFNRLAALKLNVPALLALQGVDQIVAVVDGSTDGSAQWLRSLGDPRVEVIVQRQQGSPAARNRGIAATRGRWVLMTEDDCHLPADFAVSLLEVARERDADIVSAPWLAIGRLEDAPAALCAARDAAVPSIGLATHPSVFPAGDVVTPFLNGIVLVRREVFESVRYDEKLGGNAWREETSLFLAAVERGFRCVLTPRTASFQLGQWDGGQRRGRVAYEAWAMRNNWRFLRRHQRTLVQLGAIRGPVSAELAFVAERLRAVISGTLAARWRRLARSGVDPLERA